MVGTNLMRVDHSLLSATAQRVLLKLNRRKCQQNKGQRGDKPNPENRK